VLARRNIHVKLFGDIPMADLEVVFPNKKIFISRTSLVTIAVTLLVAVVRGRAPSQRCAALPRGWCRRQLRAPAPCPPLLAHRCPERCR
jgi:hypothetical protein